jgi:hypothetical protein
MGTSVTPGASNVKGSWTQLLTALAEDVYRVRLHLNSGGLSGFNRATLVDIGIDLAGGSSYGVLIPDLIGACAGPALVNQAGGGGIVYDFPLRVPAGATVGARAAVNNAGASTIRVRIEAYGRPRDARAARAGTVVSAYGITAASSDGTSVTPGTTSEGARTEIGTIGPEEPWAWQVMASVNNNILGGASYTVDLGIGNGCGSFRTAPAYRP